MVIKDTSGDALQIYTKIISTITQSKDCCIAAKLGKSLTERLQISITKELTCTKCRMQNVTTSTCHNIILPTNVPIRRTVAQYSLQTSIQEHCFECNNSHTLLRANIITIPPQILCISFTKQHTNTIIGQSFIPINIQLYGEGNISSGAYKLHSVIYKHAHHYDALCIDKPGKGYIYCGSDIKKQPTSTENIPQSTAHVIFYKLENTFITKPIHMITAESFHFCEVQKILKLDHLAKEVRTDVLKLVNEYNDIFCLDEDTLTVCPILQHDIQLYTDSSIVNVKQFRRSNWENEQIDKHIAKLLKNGIIEPSTSPYNSPIFLVKKKGLDAEGKVKQRVVSDFRLINKISLPQHFPTPNVHSICDAFGKSRHFSVFDLSQGYHQLLLSQESRAKTAFSNRYSKYQYVRLPMGLRNSSHTFQLAMFLALGDLVGKILFLYMDDIIVFSNTIPEHLERLQILFARLRKEHLQLAPDKCEFLKTQIKFLGYIITDHGMYPNPEKVQAIAAIPPPKNARAIKSFLGMCAYYARFIPAYSQRTAVMTNLLKKNIKFKWSEECQQAFEYLKDKLMNPPILQYPDFNKPFTVTTDASMTALSAILSQNIDGSDLPIAFASRKLHGAEVRYGSSLLEVSAVIFALETFHCYIFHSQFTLYSDNKALQWLMDVKSPNSRLMKWKLKLQAYDFEIKYIKGKSNTVADCLSRYIPSEDEETEIIQEKNNIDNNPCAYPASMMPEFAHILSHPITSKY